MNRPLILFLLSCLLAGCARFEPKPIYPAKIADDFEHRTLSDPGLREYLEASHLTGDWPRQSWDLNALTIAAFYYQPSLRETRAHWGVADAGIKTAAGRPNPVLSAVPGYTLNPANGVSPWIPQVSLDVPIETAGKRGYRRAQARHLSDAARLKVLTDAWRIRSTLDSSLLDYVAARQRIELLQTQLQLQEQIIALLEDRLKAGAVARTELTVPRMALTRAVSELAAARQLAIESRSHVAEAIGVPLNALDGVKLNVQLPEGANMVHEPNSDEIRREALLGRADVLAALAEYAASQSALQLEIAKQYPDIHINPGYQFDQGEHKWTIGIVVELPVLNQNQGPIAEAEAKREEAAAHFLATQARVIAEIDRASEAHAGAAEQLKRQGEFAKLSRERTAEAENLFNAGAADKLELATARLEAMAADLAYLDARVQAQRAVAQLEEAIQLPQEQWPALELSGAAQRKRVKP